MDLKQLPAKRNSLIRVKSKQSLCKGGNVNYYQMKRDLEKKIDSHECDLIRGIYYLMRRHQLYEHFMRLKRSICLFQGQKEMKSLQLMIQTYRENPKFGDVKKFEEELELAVFRVQQLQSTLHSLRGQLDDVNLSLENLKVEIGQTVIKMF